ncbi:MAG: hypothetical protein NC911_03035 [Candidatus Omnitrophica bacterium]|nr:hypothetical protein [Candidatus Omnitrophota bacterium]
MKETVQIKQLAKEYGADLVGIASVSSFDFLPPDSHPRFIQPHARSVIVLGFRIPRGALRGVEEGTAWQTMAGASPFPTASICVETTYRLARYLESKGWEAVPLFSHSPDLRHQGVAVSPDKPEPNVILEMELAAHAAGLGEIGRGRFFLTPEFGPRQLFTAIVTDKQWPPDKIFAGKICDNCGKCAASCPAKALDRQKILRFPLAKGKAECYSLHIESCRICRTGILQSPYSSKAEPLRISAACGRACVAHLEDSDRLTNRFLFPFREKKC